MSKTSILFVDDDELTLLTEKKILEKESFQVITAENGEDAVNIVKMGVNIDLVLMDIDLGRGINGIETARIILQSSDLPILFYTSHNDQAYLDEIEKLSPYGFISKDSKLSVRLISIKMALKLHRAHTKLKEKERAIYKSEQSLRHILENSFDASYRRDLVNKTYDFMSPVIADILGYSSDEMVLMNDEDILSKIHPEDLGRILKNIEESISIKNTGVCCVEYRMKHSNGEYKWIEHRYRHVFEGGVLRYRLGTIRDINEKKLTENDLYIKDRALKSSINAIAFADLEGKLTYVNDAFLKMWGYENLSDVLNGKLSDRWAYPDRILEMIRTLKDRTVWKGEMVAVSRNGSVFEVDVRSNVVFDKTGYPLCMIAFFQDITERKTSEKLLKESEERYRLLFENAPIGIGLFTLEGKVIDFNPYVSRILGYSKEEFSKIDHSSGYYNKNERAEIISKLITDGDIVDYETKIKDKAGNLIDVRLNFLLLDWKRQKSALVTLIDITKQKAAEEEIWSLTRNLEFKVKKRTEKLSASNKMLKEEIERRKVIEDRLRENEEKLSIIFNYSPSGIVLGALDGKFLYANPAYCEMTGFSLEELSGMDFTRITLPDDLPLEKELVATLISGEISKYQIEKRYIHKNGDIIWVSLHVSLFKDQKGLPKFFVGIVENINNSKLFQQALLENEYKYRTVADFTYDWEYWVDTNGQYIYISPSCERITGYTLEDFFSIPGLFLDIIHPDDALIVRDHFVNITSESGLFSMDFRIIRKDRGIRWINHQCQPVFDAFGKWSGRRGSNRDITERKLVEEELRKSEDRYRKIITSTTDYIYTVYFSNGLPEKTYHNPASVAVTGYTSDELTTDPSLWLKMVHEDDRNFVERFISSVIRMKKTLEIEHRLIRKEGSMIWVSSSIIPHFDENGKIVYYDGLLKNISERKKAEDEVIKLNQYILEIQEMERQKISKDLHDGVGQTILAVKVNIRAYQSNAEKFSDRLDAAVQFIDRASMELREIYNGLYPSMLNDLGLPATVKWFAKNILEANNIKTEIDIYLEKDLRRNIEVNLYRVIQEVFSNIIKHSGAERVYLKLSSDDEMIHLEIEDDGKGFSPGDDEIGERRGNGLVNIKQRVESIGGVFELNSSPGKGVRIDIFIKDTI